MPTIDLRANRSSVFARSPSYDLGGGADHHLPIADSWQGFAERAAIDWAAIDWTDVATVVSAVLYLTSTNQTHVARGSSPQASVRRATAQWHPNDSTDDSGGNWTQTPDVYPGPSSTSTGSKTITGRDLNDVTDSWDITAIVRTWAPTTVEGGGGAKQYGIVLHQVAGSSHIAEWYSSRAPSTTDRPRLLITTTLVAAGVVPGAPSVSAPLGPDSSGTPYRFVFAAAITSWDLDVSTSSGFGSTTWAPRAQTGSITGGTSVAAAYGGPAYAAGATYYWRARGTNVTGTGPWSATGSFTTPRADPAPAPTLVAPLGTDADPTAKWSFAFATAITSWDLDLSSSSGFGSTLWAPRGQLHSITGGTSVSAPYSGPVLAAATTYYWRARGTNANGLGAWSATGPFTTAPAVPPPITRDVYAEWATAILGTQAKPRTLLRTGQIRPQGAQVAQLVTADMASRVVFDLSSSSTPMVADTRLAGLAVEVDLAGWTVEAVLGVEGPVRSGARIPRTDYGDRVVSGTICPVPVAHYRLGEPSGLFYESVSNTAIGTAVGNPQRGAANIAGTDGSLYSDTGGGLHYGNRYTQSNPGAQFTIAAWVAWRGAGEHYVLDKVAASGATYTGWRVQVVGATGQLRAMLFDGLGGGHTITSPGGIGGAQRHVAAVFAAAELALYVDGLAVARMPRTVQTIGYDALMNTRSVLNGWLDELSVWQGSAGALTADDIWELYHGGTTV